MEAELHHSQSHHLAIGQEADGAPSIGCKSVDESMTRGRSSASEPSPAHGLPAGRTRAALQQRAPRRVRRHALWTARRYGVLVAADLLAFHTLRYGIRLLADSSLVGAAASSRIAEILASGYLAGWQFPSALLLSLLVTGNYGPGDSRRDPARLFAGCALATVLVLWAPLWSEGFTEIVMQYGIVVTACWSAISVGRLAVDLLLRNRPAGGTRAVLVGPLADCQFAENSAVFARPDGYKLVGKLVLDGERGDGIIGRADHLGEVIEQRGIDTVVVCGHVPEEQLSRVMDMSLASGCELLSFARSLGAAGIQPMIFRQHGVALIELTKPGLRAQQLLLKRIMDIALGSLALLALTPIMLAIAAAIKLTSRGPVFFSQSRIGQGCRRFQMYKFRSMQLNAEQLETGLRERSIYDNPRLFKVADDPRVTRVGAVLRRTSLDELPQLFNVLGGEMSLVGPRPPLPREVAHYEDHHFCRFDVKPGITGPWQVAGRNRISDFEQVIRLESEYIRNWSIRHDLKILFKTIPVVLRMDGAH